MLECPDRMSRDGARQCLTAIKVAGDQYYNVEKVGQRQLELGYYHHHGGLVSNGFQWQCLEMVEIQMTNFLVVSPPGSTIL